MDLSKNGGNQPEPPIYATPAVPPPGAAPGMNPPAYSPTPPMGTPYGSGPGGYGGPPPTNGMAVAALICGIIGFFIPFAAIILGHLGLSAVKRTGEDGRTYALIGAILGWVATILMILAVVAAFLFFGTLATAGTSSWDQ